MEEGDVESACMVWRIQAGNARCRVVEVGVEREEWLGCGLPQAWLREDQPGPKQPTGVTSAGHPAHV